MPLTETDLRVLVRYGMPIKDRLREVISIVCPAISTPKRTAFTDYSKIKG